MFWVSLNFEMIDLTHTKWIYILKFLPWMIFGVLVAVFIGKDISESIFKILMAIIIISSVFLMWVWDSMKYQKIPSHWSFSTIMGSLAGITTMIGNLAGPFANRQGSDCRLFYWWHD